MAKSEQLMPSGASATRQRRRTITATSIVMAAVIATAALFVFEPTQPVSASAPSTSGMEVIEVPPGMSDAEVQAMLDEQARASAMDVTVASVMTLAGNELTMRFANDASNKSDQRLVLEQDGTTAFASEPVAPGYELEHVTLTHQQADSLKSGPAVATITSVSDTGSPVGNGVRIDIEIEREDA